MEPITYNIAGAARYLGVTPAWLERALYQRRIPHRKFGRLVRFTQADLDAFVEASRVPAESRTA